MLTMHSLIGCLLVIVLLLTVILFVVVCIDMFFGQALYAKMYEKYHHLVEKL